MLQNNYRLFQNLPTLLDSVKKWTEDYSLIKTIKNNICVIDINQKIIINRKTFSMKVWDILYGINIWDKDFCWEFQVIEKWIYPYFKWTENFFYPWNKNPIWKHLFILWNNKTWEKINQWIHKYIKPNFTKWYTPWNWCIRINPFQADEIFKRIKLWAKIIIE